MVNVCLCIVVLFYYQTGTPELAIFAEGSCRWPAKVTTLISDLTTAKTVAVDGLYMGINGTACLDLDMHVQLI